MVIYKINYSPRHCMAQWKLFPMVHFQVVLLPGQESRWRELTLEMVTSFIPPFDFN
ncbi:MAG: hypothetical protein QG657_457 [Acidobacteriota bacterium]|nr:hypothetical protein [Acidobacteriota bacterium]